VRTLLANWPAGQRRDIAVVGRSKLLFRGEWQQLHDAGYVVIDDYELSKKHIPGYMGLDAFGRSREFKNLARYQITRTDKPCTPYRPRPVPGSVWPWSAAEHWMMVSCSAVRVSHSIAAKLTEAESAPIWVQSRAELKALRNLLEFHFARSTKWTRPHVLHSVFLQSGYMTRLLLLDILVEPVFEHGKFVRFAAIDSEAAATETFTMLGVGSVQDRYCQYMELRCRQSTE
jgi:hypothetical protein